MRGQHSWRAGIRISAMVVAILAVAGPATPQIWTGASSADDLRYRLSVIDAELADIRARLGYAPSAAGGGATGAGSDVMLRLDQLAAEIVDHQHAADHHAAFSKHAQ